MTLVSTLLKNDGKRKRDAQRDNFSTVMWHGMRVFFLVCSRKFFLAIFFLFFEFFLQNFFNSFSGLENLF